MTAGTLTPRLRETLRVFDERAVALSTPEVAAELDLGRRSTYARLDDLADEGLLETKKVGANARIWWRPRPAGQGSLRTDDGGVARLVRNVPGAVYRRPDEPGEGFAYVSRAVADLSGYDPVELEAGDVSWDRDVVHPGDRFHVRKERRDQLAADAEFELEYRILTADGEVRWVRDRGRAPTGDASAPVLEGVVTEVTEQVRSRRALAQREQQFRSLVDATEEYAIFLLDPDGHVQTWNPGAERIKGYDTGEIVGEHFSTFYTDEDREAGVPERNLRIAAEKGSVQDEGWRVDSDGDRFWANVTLTAIRDDDGALRGYTKVTRNMTERREREQQLRRERDLNERLLDIAPMRLAVFRPDGTMERVTTRSQSHVGIDDDEIDDYDLADFDMYDPDGNPLDVADHPMGRVAETGEPVTGQLIQHDTPDGERRWVHLNAAPLFDDEGDLDRIVVTGKDVTELKRKERALARERDALESELAEVFSRVDDAFFALDTDWRVTYVNDHAATLLDRSRGELLQENFWEEFPAAEESTFAEEYKRAAETQEPVTFVEYYPPLGAWFEVSAYPSETGLSVYFRDVTERRQRKQELERYEAIVETVHDGIYVVDEDEYFTQVNEAYVELTGYSRQELLGSHVSTIIDSDVGGEAQRLEDELVSGERTTATLEAELTRPDGETWYGEATFALMGGAESHRRIGVVRDVTDRVEAQRALAESQQRYQTLVDNFPNGIVTLFDEDLRCLIAGGELYDVYDISPAEMVGKSLSDVSTAEQLEILEPNYRAALDGERRTFEAEYGGRTLQFWTLPVTDDDGDVVAGMAMSQDVTDRVERERELERQREHLAALTDFNDVVRDIISEVIEQSTREEIEETVCDRLAETDSYAFAWICDVQGESQILRPRYEAGVDGYLEEVTVSADRDDPLGQGPGGRAVRTQEIQVTDDVLRDPAFEPWREQAERYGYRSSAAIPLVHDDILYGLLGIYSPHPGTFDGPVREVIGQLGEVVGQAISAVERKRALLSDEVVELEFHIEDVFGSLGLDVGTTGPVRLEQTVPVGGDDFLIFGRTSQAGGDVVEAMVSQIPFYDSVTFRGNGDDVRFELRVSEPPVLSVIASLGGSVPEAVIEDGDYRLRVHLSPGADVRRVIGAMREAYPDVNLLKHRQRTVDASHDPTAPELLSELTARQQTVLETAFHAGFFEWPRDASGDEVADLLDISSPTFHQHLRKVEGKVFDAVLSSSASQA